MERFVGTDTTSVELFFNIFFSGIETFVIPWDQLLYPCVVEVCRLGLEPLHCVTFISAFLLFWKCWHDRSFVRCKKMWTTIVSADSKSFVKCVLMSIALTPTWCTIFWTGAPWQFCATRSGKSAGKNDLAQLTMNFDRRYALWIQKLYHSRRESE